MNKSQVLALLKENKNERGIQKWKQMEAEATQLKSFGIGLTQLRKLAKQVGRDHKLARQLWKSDVYDAKVISLLIDDPKVVTRDQIEEQVEELEGGYLAHVFSTCGATLAKTPFAYAVMYDWVESDDPTRRRCGYSLLYEMCKSYDFDDDYLVECIDYIRDYVHEEEMWVRESMCWAMIGIGLRSKKLNKLAVKAAKAIGPVEIDYGDNNSCEAPNMVKHLTGAWVKKKLGL